MTVLSTHDLSLSFGEKEILKNISFSLNEGDRLGVVGVNGAGKTSLFRLLTGEYVPSAGAVFLAKERTLGVLRQDEAVNPETGERTLLDYVLSSYGELLSLEGQIAREEAALAKAEWNEDVMRLSTSLARLHERFVAKGGMTFRSHARGMLLHMGFSEEELMRPVGSLSGGQVTRLALAKLLASTPDVLLLDEPTNHLDIDALVWLEEFLRIYPKTVLVISHDRYFLDKVTTKTLMISDGAARLYPKSYTEAKQMQAEDEAAQDKRYREQKKIIARIEANIEFQRRCGQAHNFVTIRAKQKQLDRMEKVEAVKGPARTVHFSFQNEQLYSQEVLSVTELDFSYGANALLKKVSFEIRRDERVLLLGANGTGKSTLMKLLTGKLMPDGGRIRFAEDAKIGYYDQETRSFHEDKTVFEELHDEYPQKTVGEIRSALALFLFTGEDVDKPIKALSGGERARLTLAKLMLKPVSVLLLDEPTNHLDIGSREALETALIAFPGTVLAVSHDRYFIDRVATRLVELYPAAEKGTRSYTPFEDETAYAAFLRTRAEREATAKTEAPVQKSEGKESYEKKKREEAVARAARKKLERAQARIPVVEARIEELKTELYGSAATDYTRAAAIEEELSSLDEELLSLYELVMENEA
ncbi:MAG: ATP-binding cassette domain-containing protein [Ruminococcaceae bacterium]|nr:ATP-binding cassette domain-containing protein [Oscillospiraceae bacterium]